MVSRLFLNTTAVSSSSSPPPWVDRMRGYAHTLRFASRVAHEVVWTSNLSQRAQNLRNELVAMGPVYVKVGQMLSTRTDVFPAYLTEAFKTLQDDVGDYMPLDEVRRVFRDDLGVELDTVFESFTETPIASASLAQVHRGVLRPRSSRPQPHHPVVVAVKVLRTGVRERFQSELRSVIDLLQGLVWLTGNSTRTKNLRDTLTVLREQYETVEDETDLALELEHMVRFRRFFRDVNLVVPRVCRALSSTHVLTMEYVPSTKLTNTPHAGRQIAVALMYAFSETVLKHGYLHGDPHPGNLGLTADGAVVVYDYGMVQRLTFDVRGAWFALMGGGSIEAVIDLLLSERILVATQSGALGWSDMTPYETVVIQRLFLHATRYLEHMDVLRLMDDVRTDPFVDVSQVPFVTDHQLNAVFRSFGVLEGVCKEMCAREGKEPFDYTDVMLTAMVRWMFDPHMMRDKAAYDLRRMLSGR